jgi:hypothetical protein
MDCTIVRFDCSSGLEASDVLVLMVVRRKREGAGAGMFGYLKEGGGRGIFFGNFYHPLFV